MEDLISVLALLKMGAIEDVFDVFQISCEDNSFYPHHPQLEGFSIMLDKILEHVQVSAPVNIN